MKNTKLIKLLRTFSASEIKKFRDFVISPFFNKNKNVINLYNEIEKFYPDFESEKLNEEEIYRKVFGENKFDYFKIKNIISDLYNLGLEFLKLQSNVYTSFTYDYNMLTQLRNRKLHTFHKKFVELFEKKFSHTEKKDSFHLYNEYLLVTERHLSNVLERPSSIKIIKEEFSRYFDFTLINLLKFYALMLHISKENKAEMEMKMFDQVYNYIETSHSSDNAAINIYKFIILLTVSRKKEYYYILKQQYINKFNSLNYEDAYYAHMYIFGYCMDNFNINSDRAFIAECYDLFKHSYLNNMVALGELLYPDFINYVKVFMRKGDKELSEKFISEFSSQLPPDQSENCLNFSKALIAHYSGEYQKALSLVVKVNFPLMIMKVQVKIMQIQLNFQLGYFEETRELAENFKKSLVKEESISSDYRNSIIGFIRLTVLLINIIQSTDKTSKEFEIRKFNKELALNQKNHFGIKFWLEDRYAELKLK